MKPEDVRAALADPPRPAPPAPGELPPASQDDILANISASYFIQRRGMAVLALAFPILLWIGGGVGELQGSLSAYYHAAGGATRDIFVGVLCAVGAFLVLYRGYSGAEDRALDGAGLAAVVVALAPIDGLPGRPETLVGLAHNVAAVLFFLFIAYVTLFRSGDTLALMRDPDRAQRFRRTYRLLGALMLLLPLGVLAVHLLLPRRENPAWLFLVEAAGVYVFAAFWFVKSREIAVLERQ